MRLQGELAGRVRRAVRWESGSIDQWVAGWHRDVRAGQVREGVEWQDGGEVR